MMISKMRLDFEKEIIELKKQIQGLKDLNIELQYSRQRVRVELSAVDSEFLLLKEKLALYENPDYVLVPREPSEEFLNALKEIYLYVYDNYSGESSYSLTESEAKDTYRAMIEAVEKEHE